MAHDIDAAVDGDADANTIAEAMRLRNVSAPGGPRGLALYMQAVIQGAFVLAKAHGDARVAAQCLDHLHDHLVRLFGRRETDQ